MGSDDLASLSPAQRRPPRADGEAIARLREDLRIARYTVAGVEGLWNAVAGGAHPGRALARGHRVPALRALDAAEGERASAAAATLTRAFLLGVAVTRDDLERALPATGADGAAAIGLVEETSARLFAPLVDLRPYAFSDVAREGQWWIVSDLGELALGRALPADHVLGVGGASTTLSGMLLQTRSRRTLDLGTGCGIQALHASRWSERVVATDVSPRALAFAKFTLDLNGIDHVELRLGDLFAPVSGERFDRIVSNPPFVITPRSGDVPAYEYRDGGRIGDGIVEAVVRGAADHLSPGGIAQLLGNWETHEDGRSGVEAIDGLDRVAGWARDAGLEYWIVERERQDPSEYAETWIRDGGTRPGTPEFERMHAAWLDDFEHRGVTSVGFGYVLLRRPVLGRTAALARAESRHGPLGVDPGGLGRHLAEVLAADEVIDDLDDDALRELRCRTAPDVTEERHHWPGADEPTAILLRQGGGFGRVVDVDTGLAALVGACDGELPLGAISDAIAALLGVDAVELWNELAPQVRELLHAGMLVPDA